MCPSKNGRTGSLEAAAEPTETEMSVCVPGQRLTPSNKYNGQQLRRRAHVGHIFSLVPVLGHPLRCSNVHARPLGTHTLAPTPYKHYKVGNRPSRDICCYLLSFVFLGHRISWRRESRVFFFSKGLHVHLEPQVFQDYQGEEVRGSQGRRLGGNLTDRGMHCRQEG